MQYLFFFLLFFQDEEEMRIFFLLAAWNRWESFSIRVDFEWQVIGMENSVPHVRERVCVCVYSTGNTCAPCNYTHYTAGCGSAWYASRHQKNIWIVDSIVAQLLWQSTTLFMLQLPRLNSISQANTLFYCNYAKDLTAHCVVRRDVQ